jgi:hypothetical protein
LARHLSQSHTIRIPARVERAFMFFTPAGEELWVDGWRPRYHWPEDGSTRAGMVFGTGEGDTATLWTLVDFDREHHRFRYARVTPALRSVLVEVRCRAAGIGATDIQVSYTLTGLNPAGDTSLDAFEPPHYAAMIDGWREAIEARLPALLAADIR